MDEEERKKLRIEQLKAQSDYQKFEFNQYSIYFLGAISFLIAIFIPITIILLDKLVYFIISAFFLLALLFITYGIINKVAKKNLDKIKSFSKEIDFLYNALLEENRK